MYQTKSFRRVVALVVCATFLLQQTALAAHPNCTVVDGVKVYRGLKHLVLDADGALSGSIVSSQGKPVSGTDVLIGQQGKVVASVKTNKVGQYKIRDLKPGIYQLVSYAGLQSYQIHAAGSQPADAVAGVIQVMDDNVIRGQACDDCDSPGCAGCGGKGGASPLMALLKNPVVWAVVIAAAIVLPLALDDDDDGS